jgi:hypothetical protein
MPNSDYLASIVPHLLRQQIDVFDHTLQIMLGGASQ